MKKDLLICIAFHYSKDRWQYLEKILINIIENYKCSFDIIVDTNVYPVWELGEFICNYPKPTNITICGNFNMEHPFHLTCKHKGHIKREIDNYENAMYIEDDELISYENYLNYLGNFKLLYPKFVPSFVRIEEKDEVEYISDVPEKQPKEIIKVGDKEFISFKFPFSYCGAWIMPTNELKEIINDNFETLTDGREFSAMFVGWGLHKQPLIELENGVISKKCYLYHLPNNYALSEGSPNGKIEPQNIFL